MQRFRLDKKERAVLSKLLCKLAKDTDDESDDITVCMCFYLSWLGQALFVNLLTLHNIFNN